MWKRFLYTVYFFYVSLKECESLADKLVQVTGFQPFLVQFPFFADISE